MPDWVIVPVEVVPSPQLIVAVKLLGGSTPLAWVNVATVKLVSFVLSRGDGPDTTMAGSATVVLAEALLLAVFGSAEVAGHRGGVGERAVLGGLGGDRHGDGGPDGDRAELKVTTPPDWLNVPWLVVAET